MTGKTCSGCGAEKLLDQFPKNTASPDGRHSRCKACKKLRMQQYRARPEIVEREAERLRLEYQRNREARLARRKARYAANKEAALTKNREWREANLEHHRALCRKWAKDNPEKSRALVSRRRCKLLQAEGDHTAADVARIHQDQQGLCAACRCDLAESGYHVDHIHPVSRGGSNGPENLQLLCPTCNRSKGDKLPHEWQPQAH